MKIKRILYVGSRFEINQGKNQESLNFRSFYKTFIKLGYTTDFVCFESDSKVNIDQELEEKAFNFNPDIIFFVLQLDQVSKQLLKKLKKKYFLINFFGDDDWKFDSFSREYAEYFNLPLTNMLIDVERYREIGIHNAYHFQWAANPPVNIDIKITNYEYDVSFIGAYSPYREWLIKLIKKAGIDVACFGMGWGTRIVSENEFEEIIQKSKINLNLSNSLSFDIRFLLKYPKSILHLFLNLLYKNIKIGSEIKARIFEITSYNGFLITDYIPTIEKYFDLNKEIVCFVDIDDLIRLIRFYLKNDEIRELKKHNGHIKSINEHLYKHRIRKLIKHIENEYSKKN